MNLVRADDIVLSNSDFRLMTLMSNLTPPSLNVQINFLDMHDSSELNSFRLILWILVIAHCTEQAAVHFLLSAGFTSSLYLCLSPQHWAGRTQP